jgi:hypothetical protein
MIATCVLQAAGFAKRLMLPVSNDTLLRVVRRRAAMPTDPLLVVGIDDCAFRKNHRYGTIVCDLERRRIVALLPDRDTRPFRRGSRSTRGVKIVSRDRGGGYGSNGVPLQEIVRRTGHSRNLVRQISRGGGTDMFRTRQGTLDGHLPFLDAQWAGGCRNGAELWRRLRGQGFKGSLRVVAE